MKPDVNILKAKNTDDILKDVQNIIEQTIPSSKHCYGSTQLVTR